MGPASHLYQFYIACIVVAITREPQHLLPRQFLEGLEGGVRGVGGELGLLLTRQTWGRASFDHAEITRTQNTKSVRALTNAIQ